MALAHRGIAMSKHAAGPWRVSGKHVNGAVIIRGAESTSEIAVVLHNDNRYQAEDHARLIAAAPELLETLIRARRCLAWACEQRPEFESEYDLANSAIAKATGEA